MEPADPDADSDADADGLVSPLGALDVSVPDGAEVRTALARTTDLGIVAHPDDLELLLLPAVAACRDEPDRWFTGIVCTDGAGSVRAGTAAGLTDAELVRLRREEQLRAADIGRYGAVVQLGLSSTEARASATGHLAATLSQLIAQCEPTNLWTHDLADRHTTHAAVGLAAVLACRALAIEDRPARVVGVEGWRSLDWLPSQHRVVLDTTGSASLARDLAAAFPSQLGAGKRYEVAGAGRRAANATFADPRAVDALEEAVLAMDLTPTVRNDAIDPVRFVHGAITQFGYEVLDALGAQREH